MIVRRSRNNSLRFIAAGMRAMKLDEDTITRHAKFFNETFCSPPLPEDVVESIVAQSLTARREGEGGEVTFAKGVM